MCVCMRAQSVVASARPTDADRVTRTYVRTYVQPSSTWILPNEQTHTLFSDRSRIFESIVAFSFAFFVSLFSIVDFEFILLRSSGVRSSDRMQWPILADYYFKYAQKWRRRRRRWILSNSNFTLIVLKECFNVVCLLVGWLVGSWPGRNQRVVAVDYNTGNKKRGEQKAAAGTERSITRSHRHTRNKAQEPGRWTWKRRRRRRIEGVLCHLKPSAASASLSSSSSISSLRMCVCVCVLCLWVAQVLPRRAQQTVKRPPDTREDKGAHLDLGHLCHSCSSYLALLLPLKTLFFHLK